MMSTRRTLKLAGLGLVVALLSAPVVGGAQEATSWDQERITSLSEQLLKSMGEIRSSWRNEPTRGDLASMNQRASKEFTDILKLIERSVRQLRSRLRDGKGMEDTLPIARKIGSLLNDANREARKLSPAGTTAEKFPPAMQLINEIAAYYERGPLYDVEPMEGSS